MIGDAAAAWVAPHPGDSLWGLVEWRAAASPARLLAVDEQGRQTTFGEYREACIGLAGLLTARGIHPGDVVSWQLPTWVESLVVAGALDLIGAVQNPLLPPLRRREIEFIVGQVRPRWYLHPGTYHGFDHGALVADVAADTGAPVEPVLIERGDLARWVPQGVPVAPPADRGDTHWVFYTSGTTGQPKGVRHGHVAVAHATIAMCRAMRIGPDDRSVLAFPVTHIGGINWLMGALMSGCSLLLIESFGAPGTMDLIARSDVTLAGVTTAFHQAYLAEQHARPERRVLPRVRAFPGGAAPKPPGLHHQLIAEFGGAGIVSGFGMTEFPMMSMGHIDDPAEQLAGTEGRPSPGVELVVVGPDGHRCPPGTDGELRARGPHRMLGYVDASLDADVFDADGFVRTGDIGHLDRHGCVVVTGRAKEVIVRKGENISAHEIEHLLHAHPGVADVAVIGTPDAARGEMVCAVVVPVSGDAPPSLADLVAYLRGHELMPQKLPERLELLDALPRSATGKVRKDTLKHRFTATG